LNGAKGGSGAPLKGPPAKNPWDSSSDSDSDSSKEERPKKKLTTQQLLVKYVTAMVKDQKKKDKAQAPKPQPYKGDPEDLERFIRQLENVWALESHRYKKDITKIRYAANLLHRNGTDKHRDPVKWYESYHPKIDLAAAKRLPGGANATLDRRWSLWSVFVESLRSSFATRVGREQAVNQWQELKHTDSIDDFLDTLTNLMWRTGYEEEIAKDKLVRGLNKEMGLAWAQTTPKPKSLHEQMSLLRDIGHSLENFRALNKTQQSHPQKENKGFQNNGNRNGNKNENGKRGRGEISTDWKEKSVELKGIPADIIAERKKANMYLKCGKGPHKWFECFAKEPITTKTIPKKKGIPQVQDTSKPNTNKDVKISAVGLEDEHGGRIIELVTDSEGEYELLK